MIVCVSASPGAGGFGVVAVFAVEIQDSKMKPLSLVTVMSDRGTTVAVRMSLLSGWQADGRGDLLSNRHVRLLRTVL